jgi:hypothetical protein
MVAKGIPAVVFRPTDDTGTQRVEINIGQTVYKGLSFINDDTFEPVAPKIASPVIPFVVEPGKVYLYFATLYWL